MDFDKLIDDIIKAAQENKAHVVAQLVVNYGKECHQRGGYEVNAIYNAAMRNANEIYAKRKE